MKKILQLLLLLFSVSIYSRVTIQQSKHDNDIKLPTLPYYSFGKGIGITSPDSLFQLNIRFRMQNRLPISRKMEKTEIMTDRFVVCACVLMDMWVIQNSFMQSNCPLHLGI